MTKSFTTQFNVARNKTAHAPVNLLRIDWPSVNGNPAKTLYLCDRGDVSGYSAAGQTWIPLVADWGDLSRNIDETMLSTNSDADLRLSLVNYPCDFGGPAHQMFSELFLIYPPEAAVKATVYQWFEGESLAPGDLVELFTAHINPVEYDEEVVQVDLVAISGSLGERMIGNTISQDDYPNAPPGVVGKVKPIVIGAVDGAPGILVRIAPEMELTASVKPGDSVISVKDASLFPANGQIEIDNDIIIYSGKTNTSFTGCQSLGDTLYPSGIGQPHYSGGRAVQDISDYRYLFSDPEYPIKSISNVRVAGQPADGSEYSVDLEHGEVRFASRPKKLISVNTEYMDVQFDSVAEGNSASNGANASNPTAVTSNATINQTNRSLRLKQTKELSDRGEIKKVYVGVEHYEEEKLPNDSVQVSIASIGVLGTLAKPNTNDRIVVGGGTNIGHNHLETIGGIVDIGHTQGHNISGATNIQHPHSENINASLTDPTHFHNINTNGERTETQSAVTALGTINSAGKTYSFPSYTGETLKAEYVLGLKIVGYSVPSGAGYVYLNGVEVARLYFPMGTGYPPTIEYTNLVTISGVQLNTVTITTGGFTGLDLEVSSLVRRLVYAGSATSTPISTGASVSKSGTVNALGPTNVNASMNGGVNSVPAGTNKVLGRAGEIAPLTAVPPLTNITQEKVSRAVIEYFDITQYVSGWNWFVGQEVRIEYVGSSDGRSSYIVHAFLDVEYAVSKYEITDAVTADVEGIKDVDGSITGTADALIERPDHVFKWSLCNPIINLTSGDIDSASFPSAGNSFASAISGGYKLAGLIDNRKSFKELWSAWEKESRSYLYWTNTGKAKLLYRILNDVGGLASSKSITPAMIRADINTGKSSIKGKRTPASNLANAIDLKYNKDWSLGNYADVLSRDDITSQNIFGVKQKPELFDFNWTRSAEQAGDIAAFYLAEYSTPMTIIDAEVFLDNLEIEKGDIIDLTHSFDNMTARKALVLEANHHLGSGTAGKMDSVTLIARLFSVNFMFATAADSATGSDTVTLPVINMAVPETAVPTDTITSLMGMLLTDSMVASDDETASISMTVTESVTATDTATLTAFGLTLTEVVNAGESVLQPGSGSGYGLDPYGTSPYGGTTSISDIYSTQTESFSASESLVPAINVLISGAVAVNDSNDVNITINDSVSAVDTTSYPNDGYGAQLYGAQGYGGLQRAA